MWAPFKPAGLAPRVGYQAERQLRYIRTTRLALQAALSAPPLAWLAHANVNSSPENDPVRFDIARTDFPLVLRWTRANWLVDIPRNTLNWGWSVVVEQVMRQRRERPEHS